jgi:hypothetical protein
MNENIIFLILLVIILFSIFSINKVNIYRDPMVFKLKNDLMKVDSRVQYINFYASDDSFTEDKKRIYLCLKDKDGNYYKYNDLIYVSLHELAHAFSNTVDYDHTSPEFINNFNYLINRAVEVGIYDPSQTFTDNYCKH